MRVFALIIGLFVHTVAIAQPYLFAGSAFTRGAGGEKQSEAFVLPGIGYRLSPGIAIEGALFDARIDTSISTAVAPSQRLFTDQRFDLAGASLAVVGRLPIAQHFALTGQASLYRLRGKVHERDTLYTFGPPTSAAAMGERSASGSGTTFGLGVGLDVEVSRALELRARLEWMRGRSDIFGPGHDLEDTRIAGLSAAWRF